MQFFEHNFIGHSYDKIQNWSGSDSITLLTENLVKMPENWYYRTHPVTYEFNSFGHRSKELADIYLENYILFTGCSHTEGVGLELSKTYSNIVSTNLSSDNYNLGLGSTGIDILMHNLITWFAVVPHLPRALVIQWPEESRFVTSTTNSTYLMPKGAWHTESEVERFFLAGEDTRFFQTRKILANKLIETIVKCPVIHVNVSDKIPFNEEAIQMQQLDSARDGMHLGIKSNAKFAIQISKEILRKEQKQ